LSAFIAFGRFSRTTATLPWFSINRSAYSMGHPHLVG
jgi:hypothetical protein